MVKVVSVLTLILMAGCGKRGALAVPEESTYPRTYPVAEKQHT